MFDDVAPKLHKAGAIGVMPTDTVYGVVARAVDQAAVARLYALKQRDSKPGTIIAANLEQLEQLGLNHRYLKAVEQYWPGPLSVIIPCTANLQYLHQGKFSLAVRLPKMANLQELLTITGPLLTSSANHPGAPVATSIKQAQNYFGSAVDFYSDGGDLSANQPSTIIKIIDDAIEVVRQGAVHIDLPG